MTLTLIGLGLGDHEDVTLKGLNAIKSANVVYLESYTSCLGIDKEELEQFYGREIVEADRNFMEQHCEELLDHSSNKSVALLVVGDPFCATTHSDVVLRAFEKGIRVEVIHNASIVSAIGSIGLQVYKFGETVSIPFFDESWKPQSFYDKIKANKEANLHTLCLLDIKIKEQSLTNLMRGRLIYEQPRLMTVNQAIEQLLEVEAKRLEGVCSPESNAFGVARLGSAASTIISGSLSDLLTQDFGGPLHSLVLCSPSLHEIEQAFFEIHKVKNLAKQKSQ